jgi:hypothetical protein
MATKERALLKGFVIPGLLCLALIGCEVAPAPAPTDIWLDLAVPGDRAPRGAVVFLVDGPNPRIFQELLAAGELPNIQRHFVDRGCYVPYAVADMPTLTMANLPAMMTGRLPGHHRVVGVNWFDRYNLIWRDYTIMAQKNLLDSDYEGTTILEALDDRATYALFFQAHRGADHFYENLTAGPAILLARYRAVDRMTFERLADVAALARQRGRWPAVTMLYLPGIDFRGHHSGMDDRTYYQAIRDLDEDLGRVMDDFAAAGLAEDLLFILTGDHGLVPVDQNFDLAGFLRDRSLAVVTGGDGGQGERATREAHYEAYTVAVNCSGNRYGALQFRKPIVDADGQVSFAPWAIRPDEADLRGYPTATGEAMDVIDTLAVLPAVRAVVWQVAPGEVRIQNADGLVALRQPDGPDGPVSYELLAGSDPMGWAGAVDEALLTGTPASVDIWLAATAGLDFADAPRQLLTYFESPRAGDLIVFAAPGFDLAGHYHAGHGSVIVEELHVPLIIVGPGIEPGSTLTGVRRDVVAPTILHYLHRTDAMEIDIPSLQQLQAQANQPQGDE